MEKINLKMISSSIGASSVAKARDYVSCDFVKIKKIENNKVRAVVLGSFPYTVTLKIEKNDIGGRCSCPAYDNYGPCKHMAATTLVLLSIQNGKGKYAQKWNETKKEKKLLTAYLMKKSKNSLVDSIIDNSKLFNLFNKERKASA